MIFFFKLQVTGFHDNLYLTHFSDKENKLRQSEVNRLGEALGKARTSGSQELPIHASQTQMCSKEFVIS